MGNPQASFSQATFCNGPVVQKYLVVPLSISKSSPTFLQLTWTHRAVTNALGFGQQARSADFNICDLLTIW
jgi:hypothetical protein